MFSVGSDLKVLASAEVTVLKADYEMLLNAN